MCANVRPLIWRDGWFHFVFPLLIRLRRCRPIRSLLRCFATKIIIWSHTSVCVGVFGSPSNPASVCTVCKRVEIESTWRCIKSILHCPHIHTRSRSVLQECSVHCKFTFRFNCADVQENTIFSTFFLPWATHVFGWLLLQVEILLKMINIVCCARVCAFWALHH